MNNSNYPKGTIVRDMFNLAEDEFDKPCYTKIENGKWIYSKSNSIEFTIEDSSIGEEKRFKIISIPEIKEEIIKNSDIWEDVFRVIKLKTFSDGLTEKIVEELRKCYKINKL